MKKIKFITALALASCVSVITGCEKDETPETPEVKISVKNVPSYVKLGEALDLEKYVTVEGSSESFTVELASSSANVASVSGHSITASKEGSVSFTVKVADKKASGSYKSVYESRYTLIQEFGNLGKAYIVYLANAETTDMYGFMNHGSNFFETSHFLEYPEDSGNYVPGGFATFDSTGEYFPFTVSFEGSGDDVVDSANFDYQIYSSKEVSDFTKSFKYDFTSLTRVVKGSSEHYDLTGTKAETFSKDYLLDDVTKVEKIEFAAAKLSSTVNALRGVRYVKESESSSTLVAFDSFLISKSSGTVYSSVSEAIKTADNKPASNLAATDHIDQKFAAFKTAAETESVGATFGATTFFMIDGVPMYLETDEDWAFSGLDGYVFTKMPQSREFKGFEHNIAVTFDENSEPVVGVASNTVAGVTTFYDVEYDPYQEKFNTFAKPGLEHLYDCELYCYDNFAKAEFWEKDLFYSREEIFESEVFVGYEYGMNVGRQNKVLEEVLTFNSALVDAGSYVEDFGLEDYCVSSMSVIGGQINFTFVISISQLLIDNNVKMSKSVDYCIQVGFSIGNSFAPECASIYSSLKF